MLLHNLIVLQFIGGLRQNKSSVKMVQRKRTPKRHLKHVQKSALKHNADDEETADVLKSKSIAATKNHKMSSDESEGEHTEMVDKNVRDGEESEKEVGSVSQERCSEDWKESPNHGEESNKVKSDAGANLSEEADEEEKAGDELVSDVSSEKDPTSASKESAQIGSKSRISKELPEELMPSPVAGAAAGISDDEPLCKWKRKVGKSSSKKRVQ
ncbi:hypothetical protein HRI_000125600 [Hibiscus trionum]|uniref:Uncharacterized protein n=1 Tax=Hibiscus trionum TaxID=183268 RepID=A0A9W7LGX6_HIBTR|nr:hypothetical protein HRI_000125600 [Hibiscus trionum]